ncbi:hypothetical protein H0H87_003087 [Tephrocybe sp. NHM501043]|nr:hypothetical protein H0H87_003087 [Tephrocybe sp. NHM501043]
MVISPLTTMSSPPVFKLMPTMQQYDWGKPSSTAKVAQFTMASQLPGFIIDESAPYTELWIGTHPSLPSHIFATREKLSADLAKNPHLIRPAVMCKYNTEDGNLLFLFKVLSIQKTLSIQSHPDKQMAEKLHAEWPDVYKGASHKAFSPQVR